MYEDIALQVFDPGVIHKPMMTELAKFTLSNFEIWLHHKQAQAIAEQQKIGGENSYQRVRYTPYTGRGVRRAT